MSDFKLEVSDLIGLSKPLTKLIDVVSKSCGTVYKPRAMRKEAEAKAYEILVIGRAELALDKERNQLASVSDTSLPVYDPNPMNRAHTRVSFKESQRQSNIEAIADIASENMPEEIADEAPNEDWMTRFFNHAQDISDPRMQELWGKILGGEVASPSSFGLRTLDIQLGDAHGKGKSQVKPLPRHAQLAVNLAGATALFLIETWNSRG